MRVHQIKKAIHIMRKAYKKAIANYSNNTLFLSELMQNYWLRFEGGIKPADTPF